MKRPSPYYFLLTVLVIAYAIFLFATPPALNTLTRYSLSENGARIVSLIVILPYIGIWFAAFYGFIKVKEYARLIRGSRDGEPLRILSDGLMIIAIHLPLTAFMGQVRNYLVAQDSSLRPELTIIYNYVSLGVVLAGFYFINKGARKLSGTVKTLSYTLNQKVGGVIFAAFCAVFAYVTLTNPARQFPTPNSPVPAYFLPDWLLALTIVLPYVVVWFFGYQAAYHIDLYRRNAKGIIYQKALGFISGGIAAIVGAIMLLRALTSMTGFFNTLELRILLLILYLLLFIISFGFILIALGAKRLKKIEEV